MTDVLSSTSNPWERRDKYRTEGAQLKKSKSTNSVGKVSQLKPSTSAESGKRKSVNMEGISKIFSRSSKENSDPNTKQKAMIYNTHSLDDNRICSTEKTPNKSLNRTKKARLHSNKDRATFKKVYTSVTSRNGDEKEKQTFNISGKIAPGYERVYKAFEENFKNDFEECAQLCIFVKGEKVVDICGAAVDKETGKNVYDYDNSCMQNIFSSTKVISSLVMAMMVDRGYLKYEDKVSDHWSDYDCHGKEGTTIAQVLRHEAGIPVFKDPFDLDALQTKELKKNSFSTVVTSQRADHKPGKFRKYHAVTRGFILNEIARRVDPFGRTIGEFLKEEIAIPLGIEGEIYIGCPVEKHEKIVDLRMQNMKLLKKNLWKGKKNNKIKGMNGIWRVAHLGLMNGGSVFRKTVSTQMGLSTTDDEDIDFDDFEFACAMMNQTKMRTAELPSANGHASAKALAMLARCITEGGWSADGKCQIISEEGLAEAQSGKVNKWMNLVQNNAFGNAGWCHFSKNTTLNKSRDGWTGWMGVGGSVVQWHNANRISFSYTPNMLEVAFNNPRGMELQEIALECAEDIETASGVVSNRRNSM